MTDDDEDNIDVVLRLPAPPLRTHVVAYRGYRERGQRAIRRRPLPSATSR